MREKDLKKRESCSVEYRVGRDALVVKEKMLCASGRLGINDDDDQRLPNERKGKYQTMLCLLLWTS